MAPIKLKIKTNSKSFNPFTQLDTEDELSQTWRVCTKVKDSLENGSRYENLAWRLWFMHNVNAQFKKLPTSSTTATTAPSSRKETTAGTTNNENNNATFLQQQQLEEHQDQLQLYDTQSHPVRKNIQQRRKAGKKTASFTVQKKQKKQQQHDQYQYQQQQQQQQHVPPPQHQHQQEMAPQVVASNTLPPDPHVATTTTVPGSSIQRQQMVPPSVAPCSVPDPMMLPQQQDSQQTSLMNNPSYYRDFVLPQFSSDQDINQTISLQDSDIFGDMLMHLDNNNWMNTVPLQTINDPSTNNNNITDPSSSSSHTYTNNNNDHTTTANSDFWYNNNPMMMQPQPQPQQQQQQQQQNNNDLKSALYISEECIAPIPHQTLYNKILSIVPQDKLVSSVERVMEQQKPQLQLQQQLQQQQDSSQKPVMATPSEGKQAICSNCETTQTPLWRRSANDELLCNACGLYAKLHNAPRPRYFENSPTSGQDEGTRIVCSNCATTTTPLWRRDTNGETLCNACGLYLKLHHSKRPLSMKTDVIKKRQRTGDVGIPKGIRMINHQFNQVLSTTTTSTVSQEQEQEEQEQQQQQQFSSSSTNTNNGDINSTGFHNYTFQQEPSPQ